MRVKSSGQNNAFKAEKPVPLRAWATAAAITTSATFGSASLVGDTFGGGSKEHKRTIWRLREDVLNGEIGCLNGMKKMGYVNINFNMQHF